MIPILALLLSSPASAGDAIRLDVVRQGVVGGSPPALTVHPQVQLTDLTVSLSCGSVRADRTGPAEVAEAVTLELPVAEGRHSCSGQLSIVLGDGSSAEMPLSLEVELLPALELSAARDRLDLDAGQLLLEGSRPLASASAVLHGERGELARSSQAMPVGNGLQLSWSAPQEEVLRIAVQATDQQGFVAALELFPWSYSVPHEEVVFETGKSAVRSSEEAKLEAAWAQVQDIVQRYGEVAPVKLYVAGFTDTVGNPASNQSLSEARARAIAGWFQARGFAGPIHYQGFGEQGLAVPTPDEIDEERNRRVDYIVAAEAPPVSPQLPGSAWRGL